MNQVLRQLGGKIRHFDGAMGTMLQERGLLPGESPELWGLAHREEIVQIHRAYLEAGADFLKTNTFGANRFKLEGSGHTVEEVVTAGVENALQAVEACGHGTVFLDIGPTGKLLRPLGELDFEEAVSAFGEMVQAGCRAGAQGILLETMSDIYEAKAGRAKAKGLGLRWESIMPTKAVPWPGKSWSCSREMPDISSVFMAASTSAR